MLDRSVGGYNYSVSQLYIIRRFEILRKLKYSKRVPSFDLLYCTYDRVRLIQVETNMTVRQKVTFFIFIFSPCFRSITIIFYFEYLHGGNDFVGALIFVCFVSVVAN